MTQKFTLRRLPGLFLAMICLLCVMSSGVQAQVYNNGPISTGATLSSGGAAPTGYTWSEMQGTNVNFGFGHSIDGGNSIIENFTVVGSWTVTSMRFFGYSTGATSETVSPFNRVFVRIYNTDPGVGTPTPIFGDLTTNRFASSANNFVYRTQQATAGTTRRVWTIDANVSVTLPAGNYWVEWQIGTVTPAASNFVPAVTIAGQNGAPGANARQRTIATGAIAAVLDAAVPQEIPFIINYSTSACSGTPTPGNTVSSSNSVCLNIPYTLSLQNATPGSGVTYQWQSSTTGAAGSYTNINGANSSTYATTGSVTTWYQAIVTCGASSATSNPIQVTVTPCYCTAGATSLTFEKISNVTFGTINNNSTATAGYEDFTAISTNAFIGATMPISVSIAGGFAADQVRVWVDFNKDFDFNDAGEEVYVSANGVGPHSGTITIPSTVTTGTTRMRVRMHDTSLGPNNTPCGTSTYGQVEDYTVNFVPCVPVTVTTQPANRSVACGASTTFTVAVAGSIPSVYWEYRTSATGIWLNVPNAAPYSGVNTTTLNIAIVTSAMNGYQYRAVHQGVCSGADFSNAATLTVTPLVPVFNVTLPINKCVSDPPRQISILNPSGATTTQSFASAAALNIAIPDNGSVAGINNTITAAGIPAGSSVTGIAVRINLAHNWVGDLILALKAPNGKVINLSAALGLTGGAAASTGFTNTVISSTGVNPLSGGTSPYTATFRADARVANFFGPYDPYLTTSLSPGPTGYAPDAALWSDLFSQGNGNWTLALYDYYADNLTGNRLINWSVDITYGTLATGVFTPSTGLFTDAAGTVAYTGTAVNTVYANPSASTAYSVTVTTPSCTSAATPVQVNVHTPITGTSTVANAATCVGGNATFTASAPTSGGTIAHQWQVKIGTAAFANVANGGVYSGATTGTLTITSATAAMNGYVYRDSMSVASCNSSLVSSSGTLTVNALPVLTVSANPFTAIQPGQTTTLTVASSTTVPAGGYQWYRNGILIPGATGNTLVVDVDALGEYTVTVSDANGCGSANTPSITVSSSPSDILFIYPSPNSGQFQVRYYSAPGNNPLPRFVNIYDSKGSRVYSRQYTIAAPYTNLAVNLSHLNGGIYHVELSDRNGNRIKTGRVLIQK